MGPEHFNMSAGHLRNKGGLEELRILPKTPPQLVDITVQMGVTGASDPFRQAGATPQLSINYLLLRSRNFIFGGSVMNSTAKEDR
jgi:hypothetical protein